MKERSVMFGASNSVFGIITEPVADTIDLSRPAIVILNAGLMHRIGPFRLNVDLARRLAKLGFIVMRIDCSGKGDSPSRADATSYRDATQQDIASALDFLQSARGATKFMLIGLCSGADDAFSVAVRDERVSSLVLLDGYAYRTKKFLLRRYGSKVLNPFAWIRLARRSFSTLIGKARDVAVATDDIFGITFPPKAEFEDGLSTVLDRGGSLLIVHTSGWKDYFNYAGQFADAFPKLSNDDNVTVKYYPRADHTYTISADRDDLVQLVGAWCDIHFRER